MFRDCIAMPKSVSMYTSINVFLAEMEAQVFGSGCAATGRRGLQCDLHSKCITHAHTHTQEVCFKLYHFFSNTKNFSSEYAARLETRKSEATKNGMRLQKLSSFRNYLFCECKTKQSTSSLYYHIPVQGETARTHSSV